MSLPGSDTALALLAIVASVVAALAIRAQFVAWSIRRQLTLVERDGTDVATGLFAQGALPARLGTELVWARAAGVDVGVAVMQIRGPRFDQAARVLLDAMREEEHAYLLTMQHVVVGLWDADVQHCLLAVRRLGRAVHDAGYEHIDAGLAMLGPDGDDVDELVDAARARMMPIDQLPAATPDVQLVAVRSRVANGLRIMAMTAPWWLAWLVLVAATQRLVPKMFGLRAGAAPDLSQPVAMLIIAAVAIAAGLLQLSGWNLVSRTLPRSRPVRRASWRTAAAVAGALTALGAWSIYAPHLVPGLSPYIGVAVVVIVLVTLTLAQTRHFVHVDGVSLLVTAALGALLVWCAIELRTPTQPMLANLGRLAVAAGVGGLLARMLERVSWIVVLALLAAAIDLWSMLADSGISRGLFSADVAAGGGGGGGGRAIDLLLYVAPSVQGRALFEIGTSDLVLCTMFIAAAHRWRFNVRVTTALVAIAIAAAYVTGSATRYAVPVMPFVALAIVGQVAASRRVTRR